MSNHRELEEIINDYESLRVSFRDFSKRGDGNKNSLIEFQERFLDLRADLRYWHTLMIGEAEKRSDKGATAIKYRIAVAITEGEFKDDDGNLIYDKCSITSAEKYAAASARYKEFLSQRVFYKQSVTNIADLREDISSFVNLIKDKLKLLQ